MISVLNVVSSLNSAHSSIGRATGLYPVFALDKREVAGSTPAGRTNENKQWNLKT